jgi:galactonate dehydratase
MATFQPLADGSLDGTVLNLPIVDVRAVPTDGAWRNWVFVRVETESGLVGWGEATLEGREQAVEGAISDFRRLLVGEDASQIRRLVHLMTRHGYWESGPVISSAAGGIEIALWDLLGKALGQPVHALLGGRMRDRARVYSNAWYFGSDSPSEFAECARATVAAGYTALKFDPFGTAEFTMSAAALQDAVARVSAVREAAGPRVDLLIEGHGRFGVETAIRVGRALAPHNVGFFEEPVVPGDVDALARVARAVPVPIAAGERAYEPSDCRRLIEAGVAVLQPDVIHVGGILRTLAVAALADAASVAVAPHNASGPIATAATLHVSAAIPNLLIQEMFAPIDAAWKDDIAVPPAAIAGGYVEVPRGAGLGVEVDEETAAAHPFVSRDLSMFLDSSILARPVPREGEIVSDSTDVTEVAR